MAGHGRHESKEEILGENGELTSPALFQKRSDAVCYIEYPVDEKSVQFGTGFYVRIRIEGKIYTAIVTNHHVISTNEIAEKANIYFGYDGYLPDKFYKLRPDILFKKDEILDFAIIYIDELDDIDAIPFTNCTPVEVNNVVTIFQHPKGSSKKVATQIVAGMNLTTIFYYADTQGGSSGSPVLRDFNLIGLHRGYDEDSNSNFGTKINEILRFLKTGTHLEDTGKTIKVKESGHKKGDDLHNPNIFEERLRAVCLIEVGKSRGTGFYSSITIDGKDWKVIVTNNHVIETEDEAEQARVYFDYNGDVLPEKSYYLKPKELFRTHKELDFSIIACNNEEIDTEVDIKPIPFVESESPKAEDIVLIFQHAGGRSKKFSQEKLLEVVMPDIRYKADTLPGASGSPVLRDFKLLAIHKAGASSEGYNCGVTCNEVLNFLKTGEYTYVVEDERRRMIAYQAQMKLVGKEEELIANELLDYDQKVEVIFHQANQYDYPLLEAICRKFFVDRCVNPLKELNDAVIKSKLPGLHISEKEIAMSPFTAFPWKDSDVKVNFEERKDKLRIFQSISECPSSYRLVAHFLLDYEVASEILRGTEEPSKKLLKVLKKWDMKEKKEKKTWSRLRSLLLFLDYKTLVEDIEYEHGEES
ncbi:uncharacterized protein LOC130629783 [Hydractinia symbiolongicarpus]|uniref:uncharacterized protein LOC130629783 n=1 Tax=Hydractinia symbiolongicarpus TaxID=13093 RepID=UPI00254E8675|nr:uncharacterized protein LOC130629783 [Hydractinia symbiolongicarpus]